MPEPNLPSGISFLITKAKFKKCFYQVHKAYMNYTDGGITCQFPIENIPIEV